MNQVQSFLKEHSTVILAGAGVLGFIGAAIFAGKAAVKVKEHEDALEEEMETKEKAVFLVQAYAPTAAMILLSTAMIVASTRVQQQRYAGLLALYSVTEKTLSRWQNAVITELPKKKAASIKSKAFEPSEEEFKESLVVFGNGVLFHDYDHGRYFRAPTVEWVRARINDANDFMSGEGFVSMNEVYGYLQLPYVEGGDYYGFMMEDGPFYPVFDTSMKYSEPVVVLSFDRQPTVWKLH